jgi:hypothetical protein
LNEGRETLLATDYVHAELPKPPPPGIVRVSRRSQLTAALRQHEKPIVIEDQALAQPFVRLLWAREMELRPLRALVAEMMSYTQSDGATAPTLITIGTSAGMSFRETSSG